MTQSDLQAVKIQLGHFLGRFYVWRLRINVLNIYYGGVNGDFRIKVLNFFTMVVNGVKKPKYLGDEASPPTLQNLWWSFQE